MNSFSSYAFSILLITLALPASAEQPLVANPLASTVWWGCSDVAGKDGEECGDAKPARPLDFFLHPTQWSLADDPLYNQFPTGEYSRIKPEVSELGKLGSYRIVQIDYADLFPPDPNASVEIRDIKVYNYLTLILAEKEPDLFVPLMRFTDISTRDHPDKGKLYPIKKYYDYKQNNSTLLTTYPAEDQILVFEHEYGGGHGPQIGFWSWMWVANRYAPVTNKKWEFATALLDFKSIIDDDKLAPHFAEHQANRYWNGMDWKGLHYNANMTYSLPDDKEMCCGGMHHASKDIWFEVRNDQLIVTCIKEWDGDNENNSEKESTYWHPSKKACDKAQENTAHKPDSPTS